MFLIRTGFWLALLLLVLPIDVEQDETSPQAPISTFQALGAAQSVVSDIAGFCDRNESTCATGNAAIQHISQKAKASAKLVYEYLDGTPENSPPPVAETTGTNETLTSADREPDWSADPKKPSA